MKKNLIIALILILAVVVVFAACKGNENEETTTQPTTESTTEVNPTDEEETTDNEIELIPGEDLIISDEGFDDENAIIIGGDNSSVSPGEDSISWEEIKGKKS